MRQTTTPMRLTRRGRYVANITPFVAVILFCLLMGVIGYIEGP
jgi:hypothetical protein